MLGRCKYLLTISAIAFAVLSVTSCAPQDTQSTDARSQDPVLQVSELAEPLDADQEIANLRARAEQGNAEA
ncbi:MAG TPA: hypothetical protein DCL19_04805, partial [Gammaproteobacteria bacterium]|nr:hypothetical protein [Gammaproteobacteria bacterium]